MALLFFWVYHAFQRNTLIWRKVPGTTPMLIWALLSIFSGITVIFYIGLAYLISYVPLEFKAWIDIFLVYFAFVNLIADGGMARRVAVYMLVGSLIVLVFGVQEMLEKSGLDSLEKSRVLGPQMQPNDFGAFLVYVSSILVAIIAIKPFEVRRWMLLPWLATIAKVLLATFSRGAYLALGASVAAMTWFRGLRYVVLAILLLALIVSQFPQLVPSSLRDRMAQTTVQGTHSEQIDASSQTRLILWDAAIKMTVESPILGKGFKAFQYFKGRYTTVEVHESDTHNMFLFVSSQMGIPALIAFLAALACLFGFGYAVWRKAVDGFARSLGLAGIGMSAAVVVINMFGSRMVNIEVCAYVWIFLAVLGHLFAELKVPTARKVRVATEVTPDNTTEGEIATTGETTHSVRKGESRGPSGGVRK
ncbi:MAG: O-antigen ligase family protein [Alcanivoracaceae bacterium]|nr:O-antigen ligase family protein [Alcanivoracaceae bacterium]